MHDDYDSCNSKIRTNNLRVWIRNEEDYAYLIMFA